MRCTTVTIRGARPLPDLLNRRGAAALVVLAWLALAGIANLAIPQLEQVVSRHSQAFIPADAPSVSATAHAAREFGEAPTNNVTYVVLERDRPLTDADRGYYRALVGALRADTGHVNSVTDLWSNPLTAATAQSRDGDTVHVMVQLSGTLGTARASDSVATVRNTLTRLSPPRGSGSTSPAPVPPSPTSSARSTARCW